MSRYVINIILFVLFVNYCRVSEYLEESSLRFRIEIRSISGHCRVHVFFLTLLD
jgi:hypothetical protein